MYQPLIVAAITLLITSLGTVANILVFVAALRISSMNSSFGIITKNQAICNTIMCLIFLLYVCPMQLSDASKLIQYSHILGVTAMSVYEASNLSHLLIAVNRFCAVFFPSYYEKVFSKFGTKLMIKIVRVVSVIMCIIFYEIMGCRFSYDDVSWTFGFLGTAECIRLTLYTDFALNTVLIIMTLFINLLTAFKAGRNSRMLMNAAGVQMSRRQKQRELGFIKQTFFQGISIFAGQFTYYLIAPLLANPILLFLVATLWAFMHAVEGLIILASNKEMKEILKKRKTNRKVKDLKITSQNETFEMLEEPASAIMSKSFFVSAMFSTFIISFLGSTCDIYLFYEFITRKSKPNGFQKLCTVKTVTNCIICSAFLLWVVPVTSLSLTFSKLNQVFNRLIGILAATWDYFMNSLLTVCMSCNRFYSLFFPFGISILRGIALTNWAITVSIFLISAFSIFSIQDGCACVYDPNIFIWRAEISECSDQILSFIPLFILTTTSTTIVFSLSTIIRLLMEKMTGMNVIESKKRRRRWMIMFTQVQ